ncbi:MAG: hypothetical protein OEX19_00770 [Gammaproteobacteria bacterium]|nr:hypothetical protein [Gammaproteobacteria bacterium]
MTIGKKQSHQKGAATVLLAGVLLFLMTFVVLFTGRSEVADIKSTSTDFYMAQAIAAAQAGLETALAQKVDRPTLKGNLGSNMSISGVLNFDDSIGSAINSGSNVATGSYDVEIVADGGDDAKVWIQSIGTASDGKTKREIKQFAEFNPVVSAVPSIHAIIRGSFSGTMFGNDKDGSNDIVGWAGGGTPGFDQTKWMITGDSDMSNTNTNTFFSYYFSGTKNSVKAISERLDCTSSTCSKNDVSNNGLVYWIDGNITINGGNVGTEAEPVILIVNNGNLTIKNSTVNGFVYVAGNWDNNDENATINGALVTEGNLSGVGGLTVNKNANNALANLADMAGAYIIYPGSWTEY